MGRGTVANLSVDIKQAYELLKKYNLGVKETGNAVYETYNSITKQVSAYKELVKILKIVDNMGIPDKLREQFLLMKKGEETLSSYRSRMERLSSSSKDLIKSIENINKAEDKFNLEKLTSIISNELDAAEFKAKGFADRMIASLSRMKLLDLDKAGADDIKKLKDTFAQLGIVFDQELKKLAFKESGAEQKAKDELRSSMGIMTDAETAEAKLKIKTTMNVLAKEIDSSRQSILTKFETSSVGKDSSFIVSILGDASGSAAGQQLAGVSDQYEKQLERIELAKNKLLSLNTKDEDYAKKKLEAEQRIRDEYKGANIFLKQGQELNKFINSEIEKKIQLYEIANKYDIKGYDYQIRVAKIRELSGEKLDNELTKLKKIATNKEKLLEIEKKSSLGIEKINSEVTKLSVKYQEAFGGVSEKGVKENEKYVKSFEEISNELNKVSSNLEKYKKKAAAISSEATKDEVSEINAGIKTQTQEYERLLSQLKLITTEETSRLNLQKSITERTERVGDLYASLGFGSSKEKQSYETDESYNKRLSTEIAAAEKLLNIRTKIAEQKQRPLEDSEKDMAFQTTIEKEHLQLLEKKRELELKLSVNKKKYNSLSEEEKKKVKEVVDLKKQVSKLSHEYNVSEGRTLGVLGKMSQKYKSLVKTMSERFKFILTAGLAYKAQNMFIDSIKNSLSKTLELHKQIAEIGTLQVENMETVNALLQIYQKGVIALSEKYGEETEKLTKALYDIRSATIESAKALDVLEVATKAGKASLTDAASAAKPIIAIMKAYGLESEQAESVSDMLFATIQRGVTTMKELGPNIGKAIAAAAMVGVDAPQVLAMVASTTRMGVNTRETITAVNRLMLNFSKRTSEATKIAIKYGFSLNDIKDESKGLTYIFEKMQDATDAEKIALVGSVRAFKAMAAGVIDVKNQMFDVDYIRNSEGRTDEALAKIQQTVTFRFERIKQTVNAALIKLGETLLPLLEKILEFGDDLKSSGIYEYIKNIIITVSSFLTAFVVTNVIKSAIINIASLITIIKGLGVASTAAASATALSMGVGGAVITAISYIAIRSYMKKKIAENELIKTNEELRLSERAMNEEFLSHTNDKKRSLESLIKTTKKYKEIYGSTDEATKKSKKLKDTFDKIKDSARLAGLSIDEYSNSIGDVSTLSEEAEKKIKNLNKSVIDTSLLMEENKRSALILEKHNVGKINVDQEYSAYSKDVDFDSGEYRAKFEKNSMRFYFARSIIDDVNYFSRKNTHSEYDLISIYTKKLKLQKELDQIAKEYSDAVSDGNKEEANRLNEQSLFLKYVFSKIEGLSDLGKQYVESRKRSVELLKDKKELEDTGQIKPKFITFSEDTVNEIGDEIDKISGDIQAALKAKKAKNKESMEKILDDYFQVEKDEEGNVLYGEDGIPKLIGEYKKSGQEEALFKNLIKAYNDKNKLVDKEEELRENNLAIQQEEALIGSGQVKNSGKLNILLKQNKNLKIEIAKLSKTEKEINEDIIEIENKRKIINNNLKIQNGLLIEQLEKLYRIKELKENTDNPFNISNAIPGAAISGDVDNIIKDIVENELQLRELSGEIILNREKEKGYLVAIKKQQTLVELSNKDIEFLSWKTKENKREELQTNYEDVRVILKQIDYKKQLMKLSDQEIDNYMKYYKQKEKEGTLTKAEKDEYKKVRKERNVRTISNVLGIDHYKDHAEARVEIENQANELIGQSVDWLLDKELQAIEKRKEKKLEAIDDELEKNKEAVQSEVLTASHRDRIFQAMEEDAAKKKEKIEKKYEKDRAKAEKRKALYSIAIDTAKGIMAAIASAEWWMIPFVTAMGAAQAALVNNTKFASGGYTGSGSSYIDETGKRQAGIVHEKEFVFNDRATSGNVPIFYKMQNALANGVSFTKFAMDHLLGKYNNVNLPSVSTSGYYANGGYVNSGINQNNQFNEMMMNMLGMQNQMFNAMNMRLANIEKYNSETSFNTNKIRHKGRGI